MHRDQQTTIAECWETTMAKFTVTLYEIVAHAFTVDALNEEAAVKLARAQFNARIDAETCVCLGLDLGRPPTVEPASSEIVRRTIQHARTLCTSYGWPVARQALVRILTDLEACGTDPTLEELRIVIQEGDQEFLSRYEADAHSVIC
jgi:hypothetical protein